MGRLVCQEYTYRQQHNRRKTHPLIYLPHTYPCKFTAHSINYIVNYKEEHRDYYRHTQSSFPYNSTKWSSNKEENQTGKGQGKFTVYLHLVTTYAYILNFYIFQLILYYTLMIPGCTESRLYDHDLTIIIKGVV